MSLKKKMSPTKKFKTLMMERLQKMKKLPTNNNLF